MFRAAHAQEGGRTGRRAHDSTKAESQHLPKAAAIKIWLWHKDRDAGDYGYGELLDVAVAIP